MLQAEKDAVSILLNDWTHELSDTIFARYLQTGAFPSCVDSILANGLGRVECLPKYALDAGPGMGISSEPTTTQELSATTTSTTTSVGMEMSGMMKRMDGSMSGASGSQIAVSTMTPSSMADQTGMASSGNMGLSARGCTPPMLFRPGYNISSLVPDTCKNTTSPQLLISANASQGWLALNLVNSGGVSALRVSLDRHSMHIYAADGLYVKPQEVKVSPSQSQLEPSLFLTFLGSGDRPWSAIFSND